MFENLIHQEDTVLRQMDTIGKFIGGTPMLDLSRWSQHPRVRILAKKESEQFGGSVKSRAAYRIIRQALEDGQWRNGMEVLDASSGNTAIAYAHICKALDIQLQIILPENASRERKEILQRLGAQLLFSSPFGGTDEAQEIALDMYRSRPDKYFYADQYNNPANWQAHYHNTAEEILIQTNRQITHFVSALGTTGTFTGTARKLKEELNKVRCVALQPDSALHALEGWKHLETAKRPGIFDDGLVDRWMTVRTEDGFAWLQKMVREEGLLLSPSSAANVAGAVALSGELEEGLIVTVLPDDANKYGEFIKKILA